MASLGDVPTSAYRMMHVHLFVALAHAWQIRLGEHATSKPPPWMAELESCRSWLAARAADQPYNFLHLLRLVEAEQAWALGDLWKAAMAFDAAVSEAASRATAVAPGPDHRTRRTVST